MGPIRRLLLPVLLLAALGPAEPLRADDAAPQDGAPPAASEAERAEIRKLVDELRAEAAKIRGLEWKHDVPADLLTRDQLRANLAKDIQEELKPDEYARDLAIARRLGILKPDEDPIELMLAMLKEMVGGYYDPDTKRLYLIQGMTGDAQKPVILHELVHALEDQHIDLKKRTEALEEDPDAIFVEKCLQEGSAEHASNLFQAANPGIAAKYQAEQSKPESAAAQVKVLTSTPASLVIGTLLWYQIGPAFVARSVADDYAEGMAALYEAGPVSQEQMLHPDKWFTENRDYPQKIAFPEDLAAAAGEGWKLLDDGPAGELDLALYFDHFLGSTGGKTNIMVLAQGQYAVDRARQAAAGWDGAQVAFLEKEGLPLVWAEAAVFDTEKDAEEAADAMLDCLRKASGIGETTWTKVAREDGGEDRRADFEGRYGKGRLLQAGTQVFLLEGAPSETFEAVWAKTRAATFTRDERDTWSPTDAADRLAACDFVDAERGVGIVLPDETWAIEKAKTRPGMVARATKGEVSVEIVALDLPVPLEMALPIVEMQLKPAFPEAKMEEKKPATVAGASGWVYDLGRGKDDPEGAKTVLFLGGVEGRVFVLRMRGPIEPVDTLRPAATQLAGAIVSQKP
jgi:hypothetical protein